MHRGRGTRWFNNKGGGMCAFGWQVSKGQGEECSRGEGQQGKKLVQQQGRACVPGCGKLREVREEGSFTQACVYALVWQVGKWQVEQGSS